MHELTCAGCGAPLPEYKTKPFKWCYRCKPNGGGKGPRFIDRERSCDECGGAFLAKDRRGRFCSARCRYRQADRKRVKAVKVRQPKKAPASNVPWGQCCHCDRWFVARLGRKYCSDECRRLRNIDRIVALYRTALDKIDVPRAMVWRRQITEYLADRDGRRCSICRRMVNLSLPSGPRGDPLGPSIDHVVPRSRGGTDDLANLRLTHWKCNNARGNRGGGEQLRLIG